jgi:ElaB/YqjD/DUF883 family membrane-anchored ribosome-binding protein
MDETVRGNNLSSLGMPDTEGSVKKAATGAHAAVDEAARKAAPAIDRTAAMAHQVVDKVAGAAAPAAEWLSVQGEHLNETQKKLVGDTCSYVAANPLKSIGLALVAGVLLGRVILK